MMMMIEKEESYLERKKFSNSFLSLSISVALSSLGRDLDLPRADIAPPVSGNRVLVIVDSRYYHFYLDERAIAGLG